MSKQTIHLVLLAAVLAIPAATYAQVDNLIQNPSFEADEVILDDPDWEQWVTWGDQEGLNSTVEIDEKEFIDGARSLRVEPTGATNWYFVVLHSPLPLDVGTDCTVSLWAKAQTPRSLTVQMKATDNSVAWGTTTFELTTEWAEYTLTAEAMNATAKLEIFCAGVETLFWLDFVWVYEGGYVAGIEPSAVAPRLGATDPMPLADAIDIPRDTVLSWKPGPFAQTHDVYFGTDFDDVNNASRAQPLGMLVREGQDANTFDPARLEFGRTYYWRIDEVNAAPDDTIYQGDVWSFATEPALYPVGNVVASASIPTAAGSGEPEVMVNESGLSDGQHSMADLTMWSGKAPEGEPIWLQFDFDRVYNLYGMHVWNYNGDYEFILGFGLQDITIEYATEPNEWVTRGDYQLARSTNQATYIGERIDLDGIAARSIRIHVNSTHYGGPQPGPDNRIQAGLAEIQFLHKPVFAREPQPADGATEVSRTTSLRWRPGREADGHQIHFGTDSNAVLAGAALASTVTSNTYDPGALLLGTTYYWRVDEVNEAETPTVWSSDLWGFTTQQYTVVDDFESYTDDVDGGKAIFQAWADGFEIDDNGSQVGNDLPLYAEPTYVYTGSGAMLLSYDNGGTATTSVAKRTFDDTPDWTRGAAATLVLYFYGDPDNDPDEPMWVRLSDASGNTGTIIYGAGPGEGNVNQADAAWHEWSIPLTDFGIDPTRVRTMAIGFGGAGGPRSAGEMIFDDIRLHPSRTGDTSVPAAHWTLDGHAQDSSLNSNDGALNGGAAFVAAGVIGGALSLNGTDAYVDCGNDASLDITDVVSLSAWVNMNDANNGEFNPFVIKGDLSYGLKHNSGNQIEFVIYDGGWTTALFPIDESYNGEWHHVAGTYDGQALRLYIDGVLRRLSHSPGAINSTTFNVNIGRNNEIPDRLYDGLIDDVRIYHGALLPAEVDAVLAP